MYQFLFPSIGTVVGATAGKLILPYFLDSKIYDTLFELYRLNRLYDEKIFDSKIDRLSFQPNKFLFKYFGASCTIPDERVDELASNLLKVEDYKLAPHKLHALTSVFDDIESSIENSSADDLVSIFSVLVIRAKVRNFGCHIQFITDFLYQQLKSGRQAYSFTLVKSCYMAILNDKFQKSS